MNKASFIDEIESNKETPDISNLHNLKPRRVCYFIIKSYCGFLV